MSAGDCFTRLRRFTGPEAEELAILCRPEGRSNDAARQADLSYRTLARALAAHESSFQDLATETLFLRDIRRDLPVVLAAREKITTELGQGGYAPLPAFIQQAPLDGDAALALTATVVIPRDREAWAVSDVRLDSPCRCEGCTLSGARVLRLGGQTSLHCSNVYGTGGDAFAQVLDMFQGAERLLEQCGMGFRDIVRTWIHLRAIDRDYDVFNAARREFFHRRGIERLPASTGVQGIPFPDRHDFSLTLHAVRSSRPLDVTGMSTPLLNEAWSYGSDFSRGLKLVEANKVLLYVSGTASIDEDGRTAHVGNFEAQAERMVDNISSLLAGQGASSADLFSGVTYLKRPSDAPILRATYLRRGLSDFPCVLVEAPLCRPDLLCEAEVMAVLSHSAPEA